MRRSVFLESLKQANLDKDEFEAVVGIYDALTEGVGSDFVNFFKPKNFFGPQKEGTIRKYALGAATGALIGGSVSTANMNASDNEVFKQDDKPTVQYCEDLSPEQKLDSNYVACLDKAPEIVKDADQEKFEKDYGMHDDSLLVEYIKSNVYDSMKNAKNPAELNKLANDIFKTVKEVTKYTDKYFIGPAELIALMCVESHFNPKAESPTHFKGLMQLGDSAMVDAHRYVPSGLNVADKHDPFNIRDAIYIGASYLYRLMFTTERSNEVYVDDAGKEHDIKGTGNFAYALATYNGGIGTPIDEFKGRSIPFLYRKAISNPEFMEKAVSIPKLKEPMEYPGKILAELDKMRAAGISTYFTSNELNYSKGK